MYTRDGKPVAVVTFEGAIEPDFQTKAKKGSKPPKLTGKVDGKIEVAVDTGLVLFATERIRAELATETRDDKPVKGVGTLYVTLRRNPPVPKKKD